MKDEKLRERTEENGRLLRNAAVRLNRECKKPKEDIDENVIRALSDEVRRNAVFQAPSDEVLSEKLARVKDRANRFAAEKLKTENAAPAPKGRKARTAVAIIAAVIAATMSFTAIASISRPDLAEKISSMFEHRDNVTVTPQPEGSVYKRYKSAESLAKKEGIVFLYPSELPEGISLNSATYKFSLGKRTVILTYNKDIYKFAASEEFNYADSSAFPGKENLTVGDVTFNIWNTNGGYQAYAHYNGLEYRINCKDRATLMTVLGGLEEVG